MIKWLRLTRKPLSEDAQLLGMKLMARVNGGPRVEDGRDKAD